MMQLEYKFLFVPICFYEHHERHNLLGVLLVSPNEKRIQLSIQTYWHSLTGKEAIAFLQQILCGVPGPIVLVWDPHPIHRRKIVQEFLSEHKRFHMYYFPVAAPELNPVEFIWTQISEYTAGTAHHNHDEFKANIFAGIARTRNSQKRLQACLLGSRLNWIN